MPAKKYHVALTAKERTILEQMLRRGRHSTRRLTRARILLKAANGLRDDEIAEAVEASIPTVERTRKRLAEDRLHALEEKPRPGEEPCA
jgi:transposase